MALGGLGPQTRETHREKGKAQHGSAVLRLSAIRGDAIRGRSHETSTRAQGTYVLLVQVLRPSGRPGQGLQRGKLAADDCQNRPTMAPFPPNPPWPPRATPRETTESMVRNIARELAEIEQALGNYRGERVASEPANKEFEGLTRQAIYI